MRDRDTLIVDFLRANGWGPGTSQAISNDASSRRYYRLHDGVRHAILMDAPPPMFMLVDGIDPHALSWCRGDSG